MVIKIVAVLTNIEICGQKLVDIGEDMNGKQLGRLNVHT